jgi:hypothetical protein
LSIENVDETVNIGESVVVAKNTGRWGLAGTEPLEDLKRRVNVLLANAVREKWDDFIGEPQSDDILIGNTWRTGSKDIEIHFRINSGAKPTFERSTDHRYQRYYTYVDADIFVNAAGPDDEPEALGQVEFGLDKLIELNQTTLIPNCECKVTNFQPAAEENVDDLQTLWHSAMTVEVSYWKVKTT